MKHVMKNFIDEFSGCVGISRLHAKIILVCVGIIILPMLFKVLVFAAIGFCALAVIFIILIVLEYLCRGVLIAIRSNNTPTMPAGNSITTLSVSPPPEEISAAKLPTCTDAQGQLLNLEMPTNKTSIDNWADYLVQNACIHQAQHVPMLKKIHFWALPKAVKAILCLARRIKTKL